MHRGGAACASLLLCHVQYRVECACQLVHCRQLVVMYVGPTIGIRQNRVVTHRLRHRQHARAACRLRPASRGSVISNRLGKKLVAQLNCKSCPLQGSSRGWRHTGAEQQTRSQSAKCTNIARGQSTLSDKHRCHPQVNHLRSLDHPCYRQHGPVMHRRENHSHRAHRILIQRPHLSGVWWRNGLNSATGCEGPAADASTRSWRWRPLGRRDGTLDDSTTSDEAPARRGQAGRTVYLGKASLKLPTALRAGLPLAQNTCVGGVGGGRATKTPGP